MLQIKLRAQLIWALIDLKIFELYAGTRYWIMNKQMARLNKRISRLKAELARPTIVVGPDTVQIYNAGRKEE